MEKNKHYKITVTTEAIYHTFRRNCFEWKSQVRVPSLKQAFKYIEKASGCFESYYESLFLCVCFVVKSDINGEEAYYFLLLSGAW